MIRYIKINAVLPYIAPAVRNEDSKLNLLSYALEGYDIISSPLHTKEEPRLYTIKDHKTELCKDTILINLATYLKNDPTTDECQQLSECLNISSGVAQEEFDLFESTNPCAGNYAISHKLTLTDYYNNNFYPMKYVGSSSWICTDCVTRFCHDCNETFSVDENKILWTSFKEGNICLLEKRVMKDSDGDFLVLNDEEVLRYLAYYAELMHFRNRMFSHEQGTISIVDRLEQKVNIWHNRARSTIKKILMNPQLISEITVNSYNNNLWKHIPDLYRDKYETDYNY